MKTSGSILLRLAAPYKVYICIVIDERTIHVTHFNVNAFANWIQQYSMLVATPNNMLCNRNLQLCDPFIPFGFFNSFDVRLQVERDDLDLCAILSTVLTVALQFIVLSTEGLAGLSSVDSVLKARLRPLSSLIRRIFLEAIYSLILEPLAILGSVETSVAVALTERHSEGRDMNRKCPSWPRPLTSAASSHETAKIAMAVLTQGSI